MKKLLFVILLLCMSALLFSACEEGTSERDAGNKSWFPVSTTVPQHQKTATVYINNAQAPTGKPGISGSDLQASAKLTDTYAVIIQSNRVMEQVRKQFPNVEFTVEVKAIEDTEIIQIIVSGDKEENLAEICNAVVDTACQVLPEIVEGSSCKVVDYAK